MPIKSGKAIECHFLLADELGQMIQFMRQCRALPRDSDEWLKAAAGALHWAAEAFAGPIASDEPQVLLVLASPTLCAVRRQGSP